MVKELLPQPGLRLSNAALNHLRANGDRRNPVGVTLVMPRLPRVAAPRGYPGTYGI